MELEISYLEATKQHPELVKKWTKEAKVGKKLIDVALIRWGYYFAIKITGMRGDELFPKIGIGEIIEEQKKDARKTPEQVADESISNVFGLSFKAVGAGFSREEILKDTPKIFIEKYKAIIMEAENRKLKERERFDNLTPQERKREEQELVNELFGMDNFFGVNIGAGGVKPIIPQKITYDINEVLDKISMVGVVGLTAGEKKFLDEHSKK